jgi:hypothetical protein
MAAQDAAHALDGQLSSVEASAMGFMTALMAVAPLAG